MRGLIIEYYNLAQRKILVNRKTKKPLIEGAFAKILFFYNWTGISSSFPFLKTVSSTLSPFLC